ncbi:MAG: toll/interleukin-1 receptor domain-containing protein [Anaerolineae bacterium]
MFFSYAHEDEDLRDELEKHLSILKRQGVITGWHDRKIAAGREWEGEIDEHLNTADFVLLLISADFLASDYCYDVEMMRALKRHEDREACVIPVILRPVDWQGAPFGKLQALPTDARPVTSWPDPDNAFLNVAQGIRRAVEEFPTRPRSAVGPVSVSQEEGVREGIALDLSHGQTQWGIYGGIDLRHFAQRNRDLGFLFIERGLLDQRQDMESASVLIVALPFDAVFSDDELGYVREWVRSGKGLFLLGYYLATSHHERGLFNQPRGANINDLVRTFDGEFSDNLVMPTDRTSYDDCGKQAFSDGDVGLSVTVKPVSGNGHAIVKGVREVAFLSACSLRRLPDATECVIKSPPSAIMRASGHTDKQGRLLRVREWDDPVQLGEVPLLAAWRYGSGRVVASGTWKICTWDYGDNATLVKNILNWLSQPSDTQPA